VRGSHNRVIEDADGEASHVLQLLENKAPQGAYELVVPGGPNRTARRARMAVKWERVVFRMRREQGQPEQLLEVTALRAYEPAPVLPASNLWTGCCLQATRSGPYATLEK
jgi:hypothetical protein